MNMKIMKNKQRKTKHAVKTVAVFNKRHSVHKLLFTSTDKPVFLVKFIIDFYFKSNIAAYSTIQTERHIQGNSRIWMKVKCLLKCIANSFSQ